MHQHELFMQRCLELAALGSGHVAPNPMVGAVLVYEGEIIGEGFHRKFGEPHAEVNAINTVPDHLKGFIGKSTLYVSLEPCAHHGKTPPCADLIIASGIPEVVIGCDDPNPLVAGKGKQKMTEAGIRITDHILDAECRELNRHFITWHEKQRPYITLKWAQSSDGFIAEEDHSPVHFTNVFSDQLVHKMRSEHMAIFAGGRTILSDDPALTVRKWNGRNPVRVSLDTKNSFPPHLQIFSGEGTCIIFNFEIEGVKNNIEFIRLRKEENIIEQILHALYERKINSLLVEGGTHTISQFAEAGLWDEAKIFISQKILNKGIAAPVMPGQIINTEHFFSDTLLTVYRDELHAETHLKS